MAGLYHLLRRKLLGSWLQKRELKAMQKRREWEWDGLKISIFPGVFHPGLFHSSTALAQVLKTERLENCRFLDVGCGSGLLSLVAARAGAQVTAIDISPQAVACASGNAVANGLQMEVIESDLFSALAPGSLYDLIVINPPYYPRNAEAEWEQAWYCGAGFEYFQKLFPTLPFLLNKGGKILMVLSEDCDLNRIREEAAKAQQNLLRVQGAKKSGEETVIWQILPVA